MARINPPYDGKECPMCSQTIRGAAAFLHNTLTRWDSDRSKAMVKLYDMRHFYLGGSIDLENDWFDHPVTNEFYLLLGKIKDALRDMKIEGGYIRWTPETTTMMEALIPEMKEMAAKLDVLSEAHFHDNRHSHGDENILWPEHSSRRIPFLPDYDRNWDVRAANPGERVDFMHTTCGTLITIDQHFRDIIAKDPTFYGSIKCPHCRSIHPSSEFKTDFTGD